MRGERLALYAGIVVAFPVWAYQVYAFISPGLYPNERRAIFPPLVGAMVLFVVGTLFGYYLLWGMVRVLIQLFPAQVEFFPAADAYISFVVFFLLACGLAFQLPTLILILGQLHIVSASLLRKQRRIAYFALFAFAELITPFARDDRGEREDEQPHNRPPEEKDPEHELTGESVMFFEKMNIALIESREPDFPVKGLAARPVMCDNGAGNVHDSPPLLLQFVAEIRFIKIQEVLFIEKSGLLERFLSHHEAGALYIVHVKLGIGILIQPPMAAEDSRVREDLVEEQRF